MRRSHGEAGLAWLSMKQQPAQAGMAKRCASGSAGSFSPEVGRHSYYIHDVPFIFTIPFSKAGICVLKISLHKHFSVNMATPHVEAEIFSSSFTSLAIY